MTDDYDRFTQRMTSFDLVLGEEDRMAHAETPEDFADAFLSHYGVKGMQWGVRKKTSDAVSKHKARSAEKKANRSSENSADHERSASAQRKAADGGLKKLSNQELQAAVTRMNLEQQYRNLSSNTPAAKQKERARKAVVDGVIDVGMDTALSMVPGGPLAKAGAEAGISLARAIYGSGPAKKQKKD